MTFAPKAPPGSCQVVRPEGVGTTNFISLSGECNGELPQYVAQFNGQNSYISVANVIQQDQVSSGSTGKITITAWALASSAPYGTNQPNILYYGGSSVCTTPYTTLEMMILGTNPIGSFTILQCSNMPMGDPNSITIGKWFFYATTFNGIVFNGYLGYDSSLYNNTVLGISNVILPGASPLSIGGPGPFDSYWNGEIANVQIYDTALSSNGISALYQEGIGGAPIKIQSLVGWWPLNGNANDYSGNDNNGAATGVIYTNNWYSGYSAP